MSIYLEVHTYKLFLWEHYLLFPGCLFLLVKFLLVNKKKILESKKEQAKLREPNICQIISYWVIWLGLDYFPHFLLLATNTFRDIDINPSQNHVFALFERSKKWDC